MNKSSNMTKVQRRKSKRGAAMVEGVVAIPFFILIFTSMIFIGNLYRGKLKTHRDSMEKNWKQAVLSCAPSGIDPIPAAQNLDLGAMETSNWPGAGLCEEGFGMVNLPSDSVTAQASGTLGGFSKTMTTTSSVMCNEKPATGDFDGAASFLWEMFQPGALIPDASVFLPATMDGTNTSVFSPPPPPPPQP